MNPPSPREEIEIRITALLMGELPPDEAAALQAQIAGDAELTALHVRLRRAMDLLREASAIPEQPAPPVPARLSDERRARLLAHFKGETKPGPVIVKPQRDWKWAVPLGLAASLMALLGGTVLLKGFMLRKHSVLESPDFAAEDGGGLAMQTGDKGREGIGGIRSERGTPLYLPLADPSPDLAKLAPSPDVRSEALSLVPAISESRMRALADVAAERSAPETNGRSQVAQNPSDSGGLIKSGSGTIVLSGSNTYTGGTTISGGTATVHVTDGIAQVGSAGPAGPPSRPTPTPMEPPSPGKSEPERRPALESAAGDSQFAFGPGQSELGILLPKLAAKMDKDSDAFALDGRRKTAQDRGATTLTSDTESDEGRKSGKKQSEAPAAFPITPTTPVFIEDIAKSGQRAEGEVVREFAGFVNYGSQIQPPSAALPGNGPASETTKLFNVSKGGEIGQPARPEDPVVGSIAFRTDDESAKLNVTTARGAESGAAKAPMTEHFKKTTDSATISAGDRVALNNNGTGKWDLAEANTLTDGTRKGTANGNSPAAARDGKPVGGGFVTTGALSAAVPEMSGEGAAQKSREGIENPKDPYGKDATRAMAAWEVDKKWAQPASRLDAVAGKGKKDTKQSGAIADEDFVVTKTNSDPKGETAESKTKEKFADIRQSNVEELDFNWLNENSKTPVLGDIPMTGRLFNTRQQDEKTTAPVDRAEAMIENALDAPMTLRDREKQEKAGDSKDAVVALGTGTVTTSDKLQKDLAPAQKKQLEAGLKVTSEIAEHLQEKRVEEAKPALKELKKVAEPEPEAPRPAPNPLVPQPEIRTGENAFSTFSLNVSDVAFKLAGASLERGTMPDVSTLRTEEFINAFDYRDPEARAGAPLAFASERARYPFAQNRDVVRFSVKTAAAGRAPGKPLNVVLLLDNSGSMERADRIRILQEGLRTLSAQLQPQDRLSVVTFARTPRLWADGVAGDKAAEVTARVGEITPEGGTNLAAALDLGYATALKHYQPGSINHVVLLTDGAANLGNVDPAALKQKVEAHRKQGIALDCFGIGWEGLNDDMLEQLSRNGDGRYGFINTPEEAATNFAGQLAGALRVSASDVKVQVEWNPKRVASYRQVGYAKHQLTKEQFRDNTVDAAELTAAESGNALYIVEVNPQGQGDLATVRVRFKVPGTSDYREHEWAVPFTRAAAPLENSSSSLRLAASAAAFSEMLAGSPFATEVTSDRLLGLLTGVPAIYGADARPKKLEWMIRQAKSISGR